MDGLKNYCKVYFWDIVTKNYVNFKGRERRKVFWLFNLNTFIISLILNYLIPGGIASVFFALAILLPSLCLGVRRLHDRNFSGWWYLVNAVPFIGLCVFIVFACLKGTEGDNRFGSEPGSAEPSLENIETIASV
jgi:uncharacterized membrane protein YhaH (DUF805 family)